MEEVNECVNLLHKLEVPLEHLESLVLQAAEVALRFLTFCFWYFQCREDLSTLAGPHSDILELVDAGCASFLPDLSLIASLMSSLFPQSTFTSLKLLDQLVRSVLCFHLRGQVCSENSTK